MKPEHVVTLIGVAIAVAAIALVLIAIVVELRRTYLQLIVILGAVSDTVGKTDGLDSITAEIARDVATGQQALMECVERLEGRLGGYAQQPASPEPAGAATSSPHANEPPQAGSFSNY